MAKIIILNAPAGAGKDTIGFHFSVMAECPTVSFKTPMFEIAKAILGKTTFNDFMDAYEDRSRKEEPQQFLGGKSCREFMIWISEVVIKPTFGKAYFGERFLENVEELEVNHGERVMVCTDGGFPDELIPLIQAGHEVIVCRLHRTGFTFDGDSRNYVHLPIGWQGVNGYRELDFILVDGDPAHTAKQIIEQISK